MGHVDNAEAIPHVAGESVTTTRGASGPDWSNLQKDYERLGSFKAVAKLYGVAPETVSRKAKELGVDSARRWRMNNLDPEELLVTVGADQGVAVHLPREPDEPRLGPVALLEGHDGARREGLGGGVGGIAKKLKGRGAFPEA